MSTVETVILTLVGVSILAVGIMILMQLRQGQSQQQPEVIVKNIDPWFYYGRRGPYYAHLPVRPILY
jgi:hypothetical protein